MNKTEPRDWPRRKLFALCLLVVLLAACSTVGISSTPQVDPATLTPTPLPSATQTITTAPTESPAPTSTQSPYPLKITADRLDKLRLFHRFDSLGFYSPENEWVVLYDNQQTAIWDLRGETLLATFEGRQRAVAGDYLLTATGDQLLLWQVSTGEQVLSFEARQGQFHSGEPWIIVYATPTGNAELWDYQVGELLGEFEEYPQDYFAFSPDGELLAASGGSENQVRVWELPDLDLLYQFEEFRVSQNRNLRVTFTRDGRYLIVSGSEEIKIFDLETGELIFANIDSWAVYPGLDSRYAFLTTDATTRIYDMQQGRYFNTYLLGDTPAFFSEVNLITNHDANVVAYNLYIYEFGSFEAVTTLNFPEGVFGNGSFYRDENLFVAADQSGVIRFYDTRVWEPVFRMEVPNAASVYRPEFSRGGHWLFFGWSAVGATGETFNVFEVWGIPE